ncbi:hypothetical protein [Roseomonas populi]|uniref:Tail assembly chaperone n=1 Tax=Roseomonas populi TaxID=3121582 RepID=A0ABT1X106_9PROT|nr:hypothetical protein [Roseomonas pecuniae]MCR0981791.1 hypothetical protein [Roseomonas pecuniae]
MASTATTAPVVTGGGVRVTMPLGERKYILAAPTLAEVGAFLDAQAMSDAPTDAELQQAIREALEATAAGTEALDAYDRAEDRWVAFTSIHILTGPDASREIQEQAMEVRTEMLAARRRRDLAISSIARDPKLKAMQAEQAKAQRLARCDLLAVVLRGWEGEGLPDFPEALDAAAIEAAIPMGDLAALGRRAEELMRPTAEAGNG